MNEERGNFMRGENVGKGNRLQGTGCRRKGTGYWVLGAGVLGTGGWGTGFWGAGRWGIMCLIFKHQFPIFKVDADIGIAIYGSCKDHL